MSHDRYWPAIPFTEWSDTAATLHMWTQIVGKIRMVQSPWLNHAWHVTLYVTPRGMTTGTIPHGNLTFSIDFDFIDHQLVIAQNTGPCEAETAYGQATRRKVVWRTGGAKAHSVQGVAINRATIQLSSNCRCIRRIDIDGFCSKRCMCQ